LDTNQQKTWQHKRIKPWGAAPNPVLAGRQPVWHARPGNKRMDEERMSRVKMNSLRSPLTSTIRCGTLALYIITIKCMAFNIAIFIGDRDYRFILTLLSTFYLALLINLDKHCECIIIVLIRGRLEFFFLY
jgi:hypothetical protein